MEKEIKVGDKIPQFTGITYDGLELETDDLLGSPSVIFFYVKNDTPECKAEVCAFNKDAEKFEALNTTIMGISADSVESQAFFFRNNNLYIGLLSDVDKTIAREFGIVKPGPKKEIIRSTFVVDPRGVVRWIEKPVNVEGHTERVLEEVKKIAK